MTPTTVVFLACHRTISCHAGGAEENVRRMQPHMAVVVARAESAVMRRRTHRRRGRAAKGDGLRPQHDREQSCSRRQFRLKPRWAQAINAVSWKKTSAANVDQIWCAMLLLGVLARRFPRSR